MKLVQINNKIEQHFRVIVMTPFLSSMYSSYYIYLLNLNLQPIFSQSSANYFWQLISVSAFWTCKLKHDETETSELLTKWWT